MGRPGDIEKGGLGRGPVALPPSANDWHGAADAAPVKGALPNRQKNKAPEPFGSGAKFGGGRSPRALSHRIRWAHSLSRAVCSPTPLFAACEDLDLMAGSLLPLPVGVYRVRPLRPVRSPPARGGTPDVVQTRLQVRIFRVGTVATGTASAFGRSFAPRYGSDLLTLRLLSLCSWVTWVYTPPNRGGFTGFAWPARSPRSRLPCAPDSFLPNRAFWRGRPAGKRDCVLVCAVAAIPSG